MPTEMSELVMLESGDRLTRAEFHRRYSARPDIKKAELIMGVVYVSSPERFSVHGEQQGVVAVWLGSYALRMPGGRFGPNPTIFLDEDTEVQPDGCLFRDQEHGGGVRITEKGYLQGAPEFVAEIAASSASYDLHDKKESYRRAGVPEYAVWRTIDQAFDWFRLEGGVYVAVAPDAHGVIESRAFPGLRLNVAKLLAGDHARAITP